MPSLALVGKSKLVHGPQFVDPATLGTGPWRVWIEPLDYFREERHRRNFRESISLDWPPRPPGMPTNPLPMSFSPGTFYAVADAGLLARLLGERQVPSDPSSRPMFRHMTEAEYIEHQKAGTANYYLDPRPDSDQNPVIDEAARGLAVAAGKQNAEQAAVIAAQGAEIAALRAENAENNALLRLIAEDLGVKAAAKAATPPATADAAEAQPAAKVAPQKPTKAG